MGKLKELLLGKPESDRVKALRKEQKLKLEQEIWEARQKGYRKSRLAKAYHEGKKAGRGGSGVSGAFSKAQNVLGTEVMPRLENLASMGEGSILDMGSTPKPRRKPKKTRKSKATTIRVNGTTITIGKAKAKKRRKTKKSEPSIWDW